MEELKAAIDRLKKRKAAGPDNTPSEVFKAMNKDTLGDMLECYNDMWRNNYVDPSMLEARIVMIFKKGNNSDIKNYRPISLTNTTYKIYTAIIFGIKVDFSFSIGDPCRHARIHTVANKSSYFKFVYFLERKKFFFF